MTNGDATSDTESCLCFGRRVPRSLGAMLVLTVLLVALGAGTAGATNIAGGPTAETSGSTTLDGPSPSLQPAVTQQCTDPSDDYSNTVVVTFDDENVITGSSADAESLPPDPVVSADDEALVVDLDNGTVVTESCEPVMVADNEVRVAENDPDLVVTDGVYLNDTLELTDDGTVQTVNGGSTVEADGNTVEYTEHDTVDFQPNITETNSPGEGETLSITVEVTNPHYGSDDQELELFLRDGNDEIKETLTDSISLDGDDSGTVTFDYETEEGDDVIESARVRTEDGSTDTTEITVNEASVDVEITDDWTRFPAAGDELEVPVEITRHGNIPDGEQEYIIDFLIDDSHVTTRPVALSPGEQTVETFTYETSEDDSPSVEATVKSGYNSHTASVDVLGQATHEENVEATFIDQNDPDEGETLELTAEIGYDRWDRIPDEPQEYPVQFYIDDEHIENRTVELDGDETITETFEYETEQGDAPRVAAELITPGSGDTDEPRITGSGFEVTIEEVNDPVNASEELITTAVIENTGEIAGEQEVRLRIDSGISDSDRTLRQIRDRENVSLDVGERTTEQFFYRPSETDVPMIEVAILSNNDEALANATVRSKSTHYEPQNLTGDYNNDTDRELTLSSEINNTGTEPGDQYVEFMLDDELVYVDRVTLGPWESTTVSTTIDAPEDIGAYDFAVETNDATAASTVGVGVEIIDDEPVDDSDGSDDPDEPPSNQSDSSSTNESDSTTDPPEDEAGLPWFLILLGLLGVLVSSLTLLVYRNDPENFPPEPAAVPGILEEEVTKISNQIRATNLSMLVATLKGVVGLGAGTLVVQNKLPRAATVRVRCQTAEDTVFMQDLELQPDERRTLASLPDAEQFRVGAGVDDITSHEEVFQGDNGDVGVVLRAEGLVIANLS
ncbi:hypothetical protein C483_12903 [Natrialba hulunbeirensis JCM 10989]|uniref:CARDB domain-containing protein n=1 Tax=Natrialba hulunbeirensis JCM 10989 TaxID=1227493 RepID=L9ZWG7_9EURY|nr:hypothetical protein [Natrialba hulunbeirensis]ELY90411.1 hypothetical protein C483_12903 [Natrialba hulunbeirensis JCM 10989]